MQQPQSESGCCIFNYIELYARYAGRVASPISRPRAYRNEGPRGSLGAVPDASAASLSATPMSTYLLFAILSTHLV